jgi:hypothetical protein
VKHLRTCVAALKRLPQRKFSDVLDIAGIGCIVGSVWWLAPIAGLFATGVALMFLGWVTHEPD